MLRRSPSSRSNNRKTAWSRLPAPEFLIATAFSNSRQSSAHQREKGVLMRLDQCLGAGKRGFDAAPLIGRDAVGQEAGVGAEPGGEPLERLRGRARLATLDLRDVFLRESVAREVALGHPRRDAQLPQALAEPEGLGATYPQCSVTRHWREK